MAKFFVSNEAELQGAFEAANVGGFGLNKIIFAADSEIELTSGLEYTGTGDLILVGNGSEIMASDTFQTYEGVSAAVDGKGVALITSRSSGNVKIKDLELNGNEGRSQHGFELDVPGDADGVISAKFKGVEVEGFWDHGVHIDDQAGATGGGGDTAGGKDDLAGANSDASLFVRILGSEIAENGIWEDSVSDSDGFRVDEGRFGDATVLIRNSAFVLNGADGFELDETGKGFAAADVFRSAFNDNGPFDLNDTDDGLDIDEAGAGRLEVRVRQSEINGNFDEGLDLDEAGRGSIFIEVQDTFANNNGNAKLNGLATDPGGTGVKLSEEDQGNIFAEFVDSQANGNDDYGFRLEQFGGGEVDALFEAVWALDNRNDVPDQGGRNGIRLESFASDDGAEIEILNPVFAEFNTVVATGNGREGLRVDADVFTAEFDGENLFDFVDFSNTVVFG